MIGHCFPACFYGISKMNSRISLSPDAESDRVFESYPWRSFRSLLFSTPLLPFPYPLLSSLFSSFPLPPSLFPLLPSIILPTTPPPTPYPTSSHTPHTPLPNQQSRLSNTKLNQNKSASASTRGFVTGCGERGMRGNPMRGMPVQRMGHGSKQRLLNSRGYENKRIKHP